jgi:SulP family sulfate permease
MLIHGLHFNNIKGDIFGGVVAAVVAVPLALAFGVASGAGAEAGLYGAIFVGFFAALFGGTPAQASGPTGPMTVVFAGLLVEMASNPPLIFTTVIYALSGDLRIYEWHWSHHHHFANWSIIRSCRQTRRCDS